MCKNTMKHEGKNTGWDNTVILAIAMIAFGVSMIRINYGRPGLSEYFIVALTLAYFAGKYFHDRKNKLAQARVKGEKMHHDTEALRSIPGANGKDPLCPACTSDDLHATGEDPAVVCVSCGKTWENVEDAIQAIEAGR